MSHIMYVGNVGSGKTFNAVAEAVKDAGDFIVSNTPIDAEAVNAWIAEHPKEHRRIFERADGEVRLTQKSSIDWKDFADKETMDARCGVWFIDEAPMWLDARKYDSLSREAREKIIEHRKDDMLIVSTAQDVAFIDKVFRLLCDEIRLVKMFRVPFLGWFLPWAVRPTIVCKDCGRCLDVHGCADPLGRGGALRPWRRGARDLGPPPQGRTERRSSQDLIVPRSSAWSGGGYDARRPCASRAPSGLC